MVLVFSALHLREDVITEEVSHAEIMKNASKTFEGYFVAPPGNIPLKKTYEQFQKARETTDKNEAEPASDVS